MSCTTKTTSPLVVVSCGTAYASRGAWAKPCNGSQPASVKREVAAFDSGEVYQNDLVASQEQFLDKAKTCQGRPIITVAVPRSNRPSGSGDPRDSQKLPHADGITSALLAAESSRFTLLLQTQPDCPLLPLVQEAQWCWPPKEEVHGERATIACADNVERCRLCVQHALCRSLPAALRDKYTRHDHAYCGHLSGTNDASVVETVVQYMIEERYAESFARLWQRSTVKSNLFPSHSSHSLEGDFLGETDLPSHVQVEDMEMSHLSGAAKFDEVEVIAMDWVEEDPAMTNTNAVDGRDEGHWSGEEMPSRQENEEGEMLFEMKTATGRTRIRPNNDIVIEKRIVSRADTASPAFATAFPDDLNSPAAFAARRSRSSQCVDVGNVGCCRSRRSSDEDDEDILEISMEVLNFIVQRTHDEVEASRRKRAGDRAPAKMRSAFQHRRISAPSGAHWKTAADRRTTRGLKIDFVKLDSYDDEVNERVANDEMAWREGVETRCSASVSKGLAAGRKRKAKGLRPPMPNKWIRRDSAITDGAVESDAEDPGRSEVPAGEYTAEAAQFFSQYPDFRPEMLEEATDRSSCVCVACDPKMKRLRRQENYLSESDFFKTARFVSRLSAPRDDAVLDQKEFEQQVVSPPSSSSSDEESTSSLSPTHEPSMSSGPVPGTATKSRCSPKAAESQHHECPFCGEKHGSTEALQRHLPVHEYKGGKTPISSRCSVCDIFFRDLRVMDGVLYDVPLEHHSRRRDQHERRHRSDALNCVYPQCRNYVFGSRQRLAVHMELHRQAVVIGGVERWELNERRDTLKDQLGQPHISCEFCLVEFNWRTRMSGMSTHVERFTRHRERHMHYEMLGEPWHCALEGCSRSFDEQADLEEHMWLSHAVNCYCGTCDWIVWGDAADVHLHRKNCKGFLPAYGHAEAAARKDSVVVVNSSKVLVKAIKTVNLTGDGKATQQAFILKSNLPRVTDQPTDFDHHPSAPPLPSKTFPHNAPIDSMTLRARGRPKLLKHFPKSGVVRDSNSAASAVHLMNFSFYCEFCGAPFRRHHAKQHQLHVENHMPDRALTCVFDDCGLKFARREELHAHVKTKLSTCRYCRCVLFEGYKKHISACRVLHEMEKQKLHRERVAEVGQRPDDERRDLCWGSNGQLLSATGALQPEEAQTEFLRNMGLTKGSVESIREKERVREQLRSQTHVANGKGRRSCTLSVSCSRCGQVFRNSLNLKQHLREYHDDSNNR
ncbi:hypothetical protein BIW11_13934 [Tropilaelaps mercedesae]|uniref:C2H2-type domain-containing protein n=1 Tax=Tropilaelaps mercedesae TaxID=418985 RepID=A0A1V9WZN3_9ACAR|nr:hypothetical protein BIW11_13934 [Tropilaelaps mercedesae]